MKRKNKVKAGRTNVTLTNPGIESTLNEFVADLMIKVPADKRICFLLGACEMGLGFKKQDIITDDGEGAMTIPSVIIGAKILLNGIYPLFGPADQVDSCLIAAKHHYKDAEGIDFDFSVRNPTPSSENLVSMFAWVLSSNHLYQGDAIHEVANTLVLSGISSYKSLPVDTTLIDTHFANHVAVTAKEYLMTLLALWAYSRKDFIINKQSFLRHSENKERIASALESILESLSFRVDLPLTAPEFSHASTYSGKAKSEAIITLRPLIKVQDEVYLSSGQSYMALQMSRKFITKALFYARQDHGSAMSPLSTFIGETRFERFFNELCSDWTGATGFSEYFYDYAGNSLKSPDRVVFESHGTSEVATLFQLKGKPLLESSLFGGDYAKLVNDIGSAYAEMVYKTVQFLNSAKSLIASGRHNPSTKHITERIFGCRKILLIGVSPEIPPIFTTAPVRKILEDRVKTIVGQAMWDEVHTYFDKVYWHVISLTEFQAFLCLPKHKRDFHKTIQAYFQLSRIETEPVNLHSIPDTYRSFVLKKYGVKVKGKNGYIKPNAELEALYKVFSEEAIKYFGLTGKV